MIPAGRVRHWVLDAMVGGAVALCAMTVAHAALPDTPAARPAVATTQTQQAVAAVAKPVVLIAFVDPVPGEEVVSPFGLRQMPWENHGRLHAGVDIAADAGAPVLAAADGVVVAAGNSDSYGRFVEIRHAEGLSSLYAHMGRIDPAITRGVALKAGAPLGRIGSSGTSTGPHLHFEIRDKNDRPLNPSLFLGQSFATADELPVRAAARVPRRVRVAYVSNIPASKRALMEERAARSEEAMQAKLDARLAKAEARRLAVAPQVAESAASAGDTGVAASALEPVLTPTPPLIVSSPDGRPRARLQL